MNLLSSGSICEHKNEHGQSSFTGREGLRRQIFLCVGLVLSFLFGGVNTAWALSDAEISQWFEQQGKTIVISRGSEAFPDMSAGEVNNLTIGAHIPVLRLQDKQTIDVDNLLRGEIQVAIVAGSDGPVGAVWADFSADQPRGERAKKDAALAAHIEYIAAGGTGQELLYDELLEAWFVLQDLSVMPADAAAEKIIAGVIPVKDFLIQRSRNLGVDNEAQAEAPVGEQPLESQSNMARTPSPVVVIIALLVIAALLTVSLLWLRWESHHESESGVSGSRDARGSSVNASSTSLSVTRIYDDQENTAPTLGKAGGNVRVYSRANTPDDVRSSEAMKLSIDKNDSSKSVNEARK